MAKTIPSRTKFSIDVRGMKPIQEMIKQGVRGKWIINALIEAGKFEVDSHRKGYADERDFEGKPYQPLSPAYAAQKLRFFPNAKILERTGRMQRDLKMKILTGLRAKIFFKDKLSERIAKFHNFGTANLDARTHFALATYNRLKGKDDPGNIQSIFSKHAGFFLKRIFG